jgi:hypothetical protein
MKSQLLTRLTTLCILLVTAALACGGPITVGGPTSTYQPVPVSSEAAQSLIDKFEAVGATSGEVTVSITESELTSFIDAQLQAQPDASFSNPQVYLRDGKILLYTTVTTEQITANAEVIMNAAIKDNTLDVTIESANFGPIPVPEGSLDALASTINDNLLSLVSDMPTGVGLKDITIADGLLTLTAVVR